MTAEVQVIDELPTALYRLHASDGTLLYVGVTGELRARFTQHAAAKPWWPEVARKTVTWYGTRRSAMDAEAVAIVAEKPRYNIQEARTKAERVNSRPGDRHKARLLGWHPPADLAEWVRAEAERQGRRVSDLLTEALGEYRTRHLAEP